MLKYILETLNLTYVKSAVYFIVRKLLKGLTNIHTLGKDQVFSVFFSTVWPKPETRYQMTGDLIFEELPSLTTTSQALRLSTSSKWIGFRSLVTKIGRLGPYKPPGLFAKSFVYILQLWSSFVLVLLGVEERGEGFKGPTDTSLCHKETWFVFRNFPVFRPSFGVYGKTYVRSIPEAPSDILGRERRHPQEVKIALPRHKLMWHIKEEITTLCLSVSVSPTSPLSLSRHEVGTSNLYRSCRLGTSCASMRGNCNK